MRKAAVWKQVGETPLQALQRFRGERCIPASVPMTYAGRLDPMAEGVLILLSGDECKKKEEYLALEKGYTLEVLLGVATDSGDVLGLVTKTVQVRLAQLESEKMERSIIALVGEHTWPYPRYSSKTVHGVPLHEWTNKGALRRVEIPHRLMRIDEITYGGIRMYSNMELHAIVQRKLESLSGGTFRVGEIVASWKSALSMQHEYCVVTISCRCSSGTYMRILAEKIAEKLQTVGCALSIVRTRVGDDMMHT